MGAKGTAARTGETPAPPWGRENPGFPSSHQPSQRLILKCRVPGLPREARARPRNQCVCSFPNPKPKAVLAFLPPEAGPACLRVSGPILLVPGSRPLIDPSYALSCRGPASDQPRDLVPAPPPLPSHPWSAHPKAHSPYGICPLPLTSPDSAALCPRSAFQPPPRPPPSSPPVG